MTTYKDEPFDDKDEAMAPLEEKKYITNQKF
jgi:hypothetical protein